MIRNTKCEVGIQDCTSVILLKLMFVVESGWVMTIQQINESCSMFIQRILKQFRNLGLGKLYPISCLSYGIVLIELHINDLEDKKSMAVLE